MKVSKWFVIVVAVFITSLLTANIIAVKMVSLWGFFLPAGVVIFPISYIFGDVLTEVYGYKLARLVIWLGFLCNLLMVMAITIAQFLPSAPFWQNQSQFETILGYAPRLLLASFIAYLVGEFVNSFVLAKLKIQTKGKFLWLRTIGSTVIGQFFDSFIFVTIAFSGVMSINAITLASYNQWVFKSVYETLATPLTYYVVNFLKKLEGIDTFDYDTNFSPLELN